jgi:hypothetical protein
LTLAGPLLWREGADYGREIGSSMPLNCSLGSIERADKVAEDEALSLELIDTKGRRYYVCLGGIVMVVLIVM